MTRQKICGTRHKDMANSADRAASSALTSSITTAPWSSQFKWIMALIVGFVLGIQSILLAKSSADWTTLCTTRPADLATLHLGDVPLDNLHTLENNNNRTDTSTSASSSFELAKRQSFGFFDDIDENSWKRMQQRVASRINHRRPGNPLRGYFDPALWYMSNFEPDFTCPHERRVGGLGDGPKWVCDPHRLTEISKRRKQEKGVGCLVYSVGCGGKFQMEDGLIEMLGPECEIHVFDPRENFAEKFPTKINARVNTHFHMWGFHSTYDNTYRHNVLRGGTTTSDWVLLTLDETVERLGHTNRTIDIFKIDCESCEWSSFDDWFRFDIRQILVETHNLPAENQTALDFFYGFQKNNFYLFHKEPNIHPNAQGRGVEWAYIRLHPEFLAPAMK